MILFNFISLRTFTVYMENQCDLKFHFGQFDRSEIWTKVSFTFPEVMWTLTMKLPYTKVDLYPKVKSQTCLSSLRVSCKRALRIHKKWDKSSSKKKVGLVASYLQKQPSRGVLRKRCSGNMQQIYRRTPMPKRDFNNIFVAYFQDNFW